MLDRLGNCLEILVGWLKVAIVVNALWLYFPTDQKHLNEMLVALWQFLVDQVSTKFRQSVFKRMRHLIIDLKIYMIIK